MQPGTTSKSTEHTFKLKRRVCLHCGNVPEMDNDGNILTDGMCRKCFDSVAGWAEYNSKLKNYKWNFKGGGYEEVPTQKT